MRSYFPALLFCLFASIAPARMHTTLRSSVPAAGDSLSEVPRQLRLEFTTAVGLNTVTLRLSGPGASEVRLGETRHPRDSARVVVAAIEDSLVAGTYVISWQVVGADGHPMRDTISFTIRSDARGLPTARPATETATEPIISAGRGQRERAGPEFHVQSPVYVAIRWVTFAGILILVGVVAFRNLVLRALSRAGEDGDFVADAGRRAASVGFKVACALIGLALLRLAAQSAAVHGNLEPAALAPAWTIATGTTWGYSWMLQALALVLCVWGFHLIRVERGSWLVTGGAAIVVAFTPALSGHSAAAGVYTPLTVLADGLHVIGGGGWLGGLFVLLAAGLPAAAALDPAYRGRVVATTVNAFSSTALTFAGILMVTGVISAWVHIGTIDGLWSTSYGRPLLLKLLVLVPVAGIGFYNWRVVRPRLGEDIATSRLVRSSRMELSIAMIVLLITAVLTAVPTPER